MKKDKIYGVILAAGQGRRAGFAKLSRYIEKNTMLEHVAQKVFNSDLDKVIMVTGYERFFVEDIAQKYGFATCHNENYLRGMSTSLKRGIKSLPEDCHAFVIILGDMPYIRSTTINILISAFLCGTKGIVIPRFKDKRGHPVIMSTKYREQILCIEGDKGARDVVKNNFDDIQLVDVDDEGVLLDIDEFSQI